MVDFTTGNISPNAGLVSDADGILWGTSSSGGALGFGSVFKIDPATNHLTTVAEFTRDGASNTGRTPVAGLAPAADGWLWGTTYSGGPADNGTVFKINPATGQLVTVNEIPNGPQNPNSPLVDDGNGFLWGTTNPYGGNGSIFKVHAATGTMTSVLTFTRKTGPYKGAFPYGGFLLDEAGWLWGVTSRGGVEDFGTVFKFQPSSGTFVTLAEFTYTTGSQPGFMPLARLARDAGGFVWGTASGGGSPNRGTLFKVNMASGACTPVLQFTGDGASNKGSAPGSGMCFDGTFLWGTTKEGGTAGIGNGTVFKLNPRTGALTTVITFSGTGTAAYTGRTPSSGALLRHPDGHVYGATELGGPGGMGTIYRLRFGPLPVTQAATNVAASGATLRGTVNANGPTSPVAFEYGTSPTLEGAATVAAGTATGTTARSFRMPVTGLLPGTVYHFRIVASNAENPNPQRGAILSFTTEPNEPPVFGGYAIATPYDTPATVSLRKLLARVTDPDGDGFAVTAAGPASTHGGSATLDTQAGTITYTPPPGFSGDDSFAVVITDARGAATTGAVTATVASPLGPGSAPRNPPQLTPMPGGAMNVRFHGIPGRSYRLERSTDMATWQTIATIAAGPAGTIEFTDPAPPRPNAFYRLAPG